MDEWVINSIIELFEFAKAGHWSAISPVRSSPNEASDL